jgi:hypothetical protein
MSEGTLIDFIKYYIEGNVVPQEEISKRVISYLLEEAPPLEPCVLGNEFVESLRKSSS